MATPRSSPLQVGDGSDNALKVLGQQALRISELEADTAFLRAELEALRTSGGKQEHISSPVRNDTLPDRYETLTAKYNDLAKLHRDLEERHKKCERHIAIANKKYSEAKESAHQWKAYAEKKHQTKAQRLADVEHAGPTTPQTLSDLSHDEHERISDHDVTPKALPSEQTIHGVPRILEEHPESNDFAHGQLDDQVRQHVARTAARTSSRTLRVTSSQTTDPGSDPANMPSSPPGKREPSSDNEPVVVSARSLKRKRSASALVMPPPVRIKQEHNSPERPIEVKSEDFSSPVHVRQTLLRTETSDLDAVMEPRAVVRKLCPGQRAISEEMERRPPPGLSKRVSSLSDGEMLDQEDVSTVGVQEHQSRHARPSLASAADDVGLQAGAANCPGNHALRPLSVNVPADRRPVMSSQPAALERRRSDKEAASKAAFLSEDGESQNVRASGNGAHGFAAHAKSPQTSKERRLDSLLEVATSDRHRLVRSHTPESAAARKRGPLTPITNSVPRTKPHNVHSPAAWRIASEITPTSMLVKQGERMSTNVKQENEVMAAAKRREYEASLSTKRKKRESPRKPNEPQLRRPNGLEDSPPPLQPEDEPLRLRPLGSLRLEDFRINSKHTGADHAFSETVRGRARRCLPGCTKPDCCGGTFLKAVQMNGRQNSDQSDAQALEAYFGANWQAIVGAYPRDRRENLVMEARASAFANQYGKHRNAFERRSTPPGFWRTDMPNTQQVEEDRAQAHDMVRQKVEERYREAMRDGGRWLFKDE